MLNATESIKGIVKSWDLTSIAVWYAFHNLLLSHLKNKGILLQTHKI